MVAWTRDTDRGRVTVLITLFSALLFGAALAPSHAREVREERGLGQEVPVEMAAIMGRDDRLLDFDVDKLRYIERASRVGVVSSRYVPGTSSGTVVCRRNIVVTTGHMAGGTPQNITQRIPYWFKLTAPEREIAMYRWFLSSHFSFSLAVPKHPGKFHRGVGVRDVRFGTIHTKSEPQFDFSILALQSSVYGRTVPLSLSAFDPNASDLTLPRRLHFFAVHGDIGYDRREKRLVLNDSTAANRAHVVIGTTGRRMVKVSAGPHLATPGVRDWYYDPHVALMTWDAAQGASGGSGFYEQDGRDYIALVHKGEFRKKELPAGPIAADPIFHFNVATVTLGNRRFYELLAELLDSTVEDVHTKCIDNAPKRAIEGRRRSG